MNIAAPFAGDRSGASAGAVRSRDAGETRRQLLEAARRRFAFDGYSATTVRDIATDVGVNVALINRYFVSKEGLFEACILSVGQQLADDESAATTIDDVVRNAVRQFVDSSSENGAAQLQLLLLLRSSGDPRAEEIRVGIIRTFAEKIAAIAGWRPGAPDSDQLLLHAQVALATTLGMVLLRTTSGLEPLTSADERLVSGPLETVFTALLTPRTTT